MRRFEVAGFSALLMATGFSVTTSGEARAAEPCSGLSTCVFDEAGRYVYRVPAGVHRLRAVVHGAEGGWQPGVRGLGPVYGGETSGGRGGRIDAELRVRPGQRIVVNVGGIGRYGEAGSTAYDPARAGIAGLGGANGGGDGGGGLSGLPGGGGGGGASDLRLTDALETRILVAGGGGGAGVTGDGGGGGGADGRAGEGVGAGGGGTAARGGAGGLVFFSHFDTPQQQDPDAPPSTCGFGWSRPSLGEAGPGEGRSALTSGAGGGGGGWYGGGQGSQLALALDGGCGPKPTPIGLPGGPGGGGSGYADPAWCSDVHSESDVRRGDGLVVLTPL